MVKPELYETILPTDRWSVRAVSPIDIRDGIDSSEHGHPVIVHAGWGKSPESHALLLRELTEVGFLAIGVDTRYAYSDQQVQGKHTARVLTQSYQAGTTNPYFEEADRGANRWRLRRPTSLLFLCDQLGIAERTYVGHSEGGRIVALAALATAHLTRKVIVVNGAGTGDSSNGLSRMVQSNANRLREMSGSAENVRQMSASALGSIAYAATHPRRTVKEKQVIQNTNLWPTIEQLVERGVPVTVLHAIGDELVEFEDSKQQASLIPRVDFIATNGTHSNVYEAEIRDLITGSAVL